MGEKDTPTEKKEEIVEESDGRSLVGKCLETAALIATWISLSLCLELYGPTLIDLKYKLNANYEQVSIAVSGRSFGWFPGSILGGLLVDKLGGYCHLIAAIALDLTAAATASVPWSPNTTAAWGICFVIGSLESIINITGTRIAFNIWKEKAVTPLLLIHLGYGVGAFVVPLYTDQFLADVPEDDTVTENSTASYNMTMLSTTSAPSTPAVSYSELSKIEYSYAISASVAIVVSFILYFYQFLRCVGDDNVRCKTSRSTLAEKEKEFENKNDVEPVNDSVLEYIQGKLRLFVKMINPATCAAGRFWYGSEILIFLFFYFGNIAGGDRMLGSFVRTFAIDGLKFTKHNASVLNTAFWIGFSGGRLVFSIVGFFVTVRRLILIETAGLAASGVCLVIFATDNKLALWILVICTGFFASPTWPTGIAWTDYHIELTGMLMTWQILGASIGGIVHLRLIGYLYENVGPFTFLYQTMGLCVFHFLLAIILTLIGAQHGDRRKEKQKEVEVDKEVYEITKL